MTKRAGQEIKDQARLLRESGLSYREIGEKLGFTRDTISRWLNPERYQRWYDDHSDEIREKSRQWTQGNSKRHNERNRQWRKDNPEKVNAGARNWRYNNPEKSRQLVRDQARRRRDIRPEGVMLKGVRSRARVLGLEFNLSIDDIIIPDRCPYLGIPLKRNQRASGPDSPSLDRINPDKGYVRGNVIVVSHKGNTMKNSATPSEVVEFGKRMAHLIETDPRFKERNVWM